MLSSFVVRNKVLFLVKLAFLVAQTVKNLSAVQETGVVSVGREDHLDKGMTTPSNILAWSILWAEEPGGLQSMSLLRI